MSGVLPRDTVHMSHPSSNVLTKTLLHCDELGGLSYPDHVRDESIVEVVDMDEAKTPAMLRLTAVPVQGSGSSPPHHDHAWRRVPGGAHQDGPVEYRCDLCELCWLT
jgi:hypothetical protein